MVSGAADIDTDTGCGVDLDMSWMAAQAAQISMALAWTQVSSEQPSEATEPWALSQTLAAAASWAQTWPLSSLGPDVIAQISVVLAVAQPADTRRATGGSPDPRRPRGLC